MLTPDRKKKKEKYLSIIRSRVIHAIQNTKGLSFEFVFNILS